jgi:putative membrane protein
MSPDTVPATQSSADRNFFAFTVVVSTLALSLLGYLLLVRRGSAAAGMDLRFLPAVNASLNALAATLLASGWVAIRRGAQRLHQYLMVSAFAASTFFLVGYLAYHYVHGDTKFTGQGPLRAVYFAILASHVILSMGVVPLALLAFYFAFRRSYARHRRVTRFLAPSWLYVSVTGVIIYFMLRGSPPAVP